MKNLDDNGFSLMEVIIVTAVIGVLTLAAVQFLIPMLKFFHGSLARRQASSESRMCMETIRRVMSNGKAGTLKISTPPTVPSMPLSQVQFTGLDSYDYTIAWSTAPMNSVHLQRTPHGGGATTDTVLTTCATELHFTPSNLQDPGILEMTLRITVPVNSSGLPDSLYTILSPNQTILMSSSPGASGS